MKKTSITMGDRIALMQAKSVLTTEEVALFTGLADSTIRKLTSNRQIPFWKHKKRNYYDKSKISDWLKSGQYMKTQDELEQEAVNYLVTRRAES
jgi:excisionase family DNA binding protein